MYEMDTLNGHYRSNEALSQVRMFDMPDTLVSRVATDSKMEVSASSKGFESYASFMMPLSRLPGVPPRLQNYNVTASSTLAPERTYERGKLISNQNAMQNVAEETASSATICWLVRRTSRGLKF